MFQTTFDFYSDSFVSRNGIIAHITERRNSSFMALVSFLLSQKTGLDCLQAPEKTYQEKVALLLQIWKLLANYKLPEVSISLDTITQHLDTLRLILHGDWSHLPETSTTNLSIYLDRMANNLKTSSDAYHLCLQLTKLVKITPWENTTLKKIVNGEPIDDDEAMTFCIEEKETLLNLRLETLCASKDCLEMALKLVKVYRQCLTNSDRRFLEACSDAVKEHWLDVHLVLIYQYDRDEFLVLLKQLTDDVACRMVERLFERRDVRKGLWRKSLYIAELASKTLLTHALEVWPPSAMMIQFLAIQLFGIQESLGKKTEYLVGIFQTKMDANNFLTSKHMFLLCHALSVKKELQSFCIELYVRAIAVDLNHLEKWKQSACTNSADADRVKTTEMELAKEFSSLTELVKSNARVACECALTAFSLSPTSERYETLDALQQLLPEIDTQPYSEAAAKNLGISNSVIKDLSVVVHSCRWEVLTWKNGWSSLSTLCIEYLAYPEKMRNITKDLKFLNSKLDYSQFDHLPKPEVNLFTGIEKGYEDYIHDIDIEIFSPVAGQRSKRKKTSKHRNIALQKPVRLVKDLRRMRPFTGGRNQWCEASGNNHVQLKQQKSSVLSFTSTFCSPKLGRFAPILTNLNMYPKVVLTRIPVHFSCLPPVSISAGIVAGSSPTMRL